jgi:hypothetical protein
MDSLTPPRPPLKEDSFELSPLLPITIEIASPFEQPIRLSATSTPLPPSPLEPSPSPLEPMEAHELFCLAENSDDISEILDRLEPDQLLLRTWSYFQHCQRTAHQLEKEARFQRNLADSLLGELRQLRIDEVLRPVVLKSRRREQRTTHYARPSNPRIRPIDLAPSTANSTFEAISHSPVTHEGGPTRPIIIVDDETTPASSSSASPTSSSSASSSRKRKGPQISRPTSRYVRRMTTGLPNLESSV